MVRFIPVSYLAYFDQLLIRHNSSSLPSPYRAPSLADLCVPGALGGEFVWVQYSEAYRATADYRGEVKGERWGRHELLFQYCLCDLAWRWCCTMHGYRTGLNLIVLLGSSVMEREDSI